MRITIVQGAFLPIPPLMGGGVEKMWHGLGRAFAHGGHQVTHVSRLYENLAPAETVAGVNHVRVRGFDAPGSKLLYRFFDLLYARRVFRVLPVADVLVTNTIWMPLLIRNRKRGRLYVHVARFPKKQMWLYQHAERLQTVSTIVAEEIIRELPGARNKVKVIPPFLLNDPPEIDFEAKVALPSKNILYVGRVHPEKGLHLLVPAFVKFLEVAPDARLTIVGPHDARRGGGGESYAQKLRMLAAPAGGRIEFRGFVTAEELNKAYLESSLFVYPTLAEKGEAFPAAPLEAMAMGSPPLLSRLRCFNDLMESGIHGYQFDHRAADPIESLAGELRHIFSDVPRLRAIARAAYARSRDFTLEKITPQYLEDFTKLLAEP